MKKDNRVITDEILRNEFGFGSYEQLYENGDNKTVYFKRTLYQLNGIQGYLSSDSMFLLEGYSLETVQDLKDFLKKQKIPSKIDE